MLFVFPPNLSICAKNGHSRQPLLDGVKGKKLSRIHIDLVIAWKCVTLR